jgi:hypothetical protein
MTMRKILHLKTGQALVEFALAATLIFFLLAAAVDLGLIFFSIQGLHNAAQEGAAYGSRWLTGSNPRALNLNAIRDRVRHESGARGGIGFVNLLDLNNDGTRDVGPDDNAVVGANGTTYQTMPDGTRVIDNFIQIQLLNDTDTNGDPMNDLVGGQPTPCVNPAAPQALCYIRVTVQLNYKTVFPLTPTFGRTTLLHSSYIVRLRDGYSEGGAATAPGVFQTVTPVPTPTTAPTPTPTPIVVTIEKYWKASGGAIYISTKVTENGVNVTSGASVTAQIGTQTVTLTGNGTGLYSSCGTGVTNSSLPNVTVSASYNGATDTDSRSSTLNSGSCP